jgi:hypothetical protein
MIVSVGLIVFISAMIGSKILVGLFIFAWVIFYVYMILPIMLFFFVRIRERQGPIDALVRCFRLTYGHWWRTFGGVFLIAIIALVLQSICLAPLTTMAGTSAFPYTMSRHYDLNAMLTPLFGITQGVAVLVSVFFSAFTGFVICLNYYSLVSLTDGDAIDTAPAAQEAGESVDQ